MKVMLPEMLERISNELQQTALISGDIENLVNSILSSTDRIRAEDFARLQGLDLLNQIIVELASFTHELSKVAPKQEILVDQALSKVRLRDVAARLEGSRDSEARSEGADDMTIIF